MDKKKILIVEDDKDIQMIEEAYLQASNFETTTLSDGNLVQEILQKESFDLILLDLMLPNKSGYTICEEIRNKVDIPILMVTARTESLDKIRGLGLGADDYIAKPFDPSELVARVQAHLREYERLTLKNSYKEEKIQIQNMTIDLKSRKVFKNEFEIKFPSKEFDLLAFFAKNPNIVFSKEQLFEKIWGLDYIEDNATIMVHVNRIREKIEENPKKPKILETIWGVGYRFNA